MRSLWQLQRSVSKIVKRDSIPKPQIVRGATRASFVWLTTLHVSTSCGSRLGFYEFNEEYRTSR